jgi:phosphoribosylformylglycinamidine (FGAM) synthase-like amidotransferase family enzyme
MATEKWRLQYMQAVRYNWKMTVKLISPTSTTYVLVPCTCYLVILNCVCPHRAWDAGMQPWDVTMSDILEGRITLDDFQGLVFVGGFSYADTLNSAKGWASAIRFSENALAQFDAFAARPDTFSLGVCNGCQLMALLGWVPRGEDGDALEGVRQPRFVHNASGSLPSTLLLPSAIRSARLTSRIQVEARPVASGEHILLTADH